MNYEQNKHEAAIKVIIFMLFLFYIWMGTVTYRFKYTRIDRTLDTQPTKERLQQIENARAFGCVLLSFAWPAYWVMYVCYHTTSWAEKPMDVKEIEK